MHSLLSCTISGCYTCILLILTLNCVTLSLSKLSFAWISHPRLSCEYHAQITFFSSSFLMNWVPYWSPTNFIPRRSTTFPEFSLICIVLVFSCYLVYTSLAYEVSSSLYNGASWSFVSIWYFPICLVVPCLHCFYLWHHPWYWRLTGHLILDFCGILVQFIIPIWWVAILFFSDVFFLFSLSFSFSIFYNTIIVLVAVKWCLLISWFTVGLFYDWNYWNQFKNKVSLGHLWLLFLCRNLI